MAFASAVTKRVELHVGLAGPVDVYAQCIREAACGQTAVGAPAGIHQPVQHGQAHLLEHPRRGKPCIGICCALHYGTQYHAEYHHDC